MIVELACRVSSCGWVALCERRRAGFARLSGESRRVRRKMARSPSRAGGRRTQPAQRKGRKPSPAAGEFFLNRRSIVRPLGEARGYLVNHRFAAEEDGPLGRLKGTQARVRIRGKFGPDSPV